MQEGEKAPHGSRQQSRLDVRWHPRRCLYHDLLGCELHRVGKATALFGLTALDGKVMGHHSRHSARRLILSWRPLNTRRRPTKGLDTDFDEERFWPMRMQRMPALSERRHPLLDLAASEAL